MDRFNSYLEAIKNNKIRAMLMDTVHWISVNYPEFKATIKWNQPMFIHHSTFVIGFSVAKKHLNVAPDQKVIDRFDKAITEVGYTRTKMLIQIKENQSVDYVFLKKMIDYIVELKKDVTSFWL